MLLDLFCMSEGLSPMIWVHSKCFSWSNWHGFGIQNHIWVNHSLCLPSIELLRGRLWTLLPSLFLGSALRFVHSGMFVKLLSNVIVGFLLTFSSKVNNCFNKVFLCYFLNVIILFHCSKLLPIITLSNHIGRCRTWYISIYLEHYPLQSAESAT